MSKNNDGSSGIRIPLIFALPSRLAVFALIVFSALLWVSDPLGIIDPFMVFTPAKLTFIAAGFIALILLLSLFVFRPWCTLACPFGTIAWLAERFAWLRVRFSPESCLHCDLCKKACPTGHVDALLTGKSIKPDCFACGDCLAACPTKALTFGKPAQDHTIAFGGKVNLTTPRVPLK